MKAFIICAFLALTSGKLADRVSISKAHLEQLKKIADFEVYNHEEHPFKDLSPFDLQMKLGLRGMNFHLTHTLPNGDVSALPDAFDARESWPSCVHPIRDQQSCGSCWAFAASEVLSDRFCIASNGDVDVVMSPQDLVSCDKNDLGCNGGYLDRSWSYLVNTGIVSDECYPYTSGSGSTGTCNVSTGKCANGTSQFKKYKASAFKTYSSVEEIKTDLMTNGPIETGFLVYQDFMSYKGGVYKKSSNTLLGGHAVKVVGWGNENGTDYWIVANSWGPNWGEKGHFRMAVGNCCNFESQMISGTPQL